jgi:transposase
MRGKKGTLHPDPADPPRRRANKVRGHGTWDNDRPPVFGTVGRASGQLRLRVGSGSTAVALLAFVEDTTQADVTLNTDEWRGYNPVSRTGRAHVTVCHTPGQRVWARDDDGDGIKEVHNNTIEGIWTGLRNFLRPFRGVSKWFLHQYVAIFQWCHNLKVASDDFLQALLGVSETTDQNT